MIKYAATGYAEFAITTNFSFLRGGSHPEELVEQGLELGLKGLGIADRNSLAGVVRAHVFLRENHVKPSEFKLAIGTRLVFCDGTPDILAYPKNRAAYGRLTRLLTRGNLRAEKGGCLLRLKDLLDQAVDFQLALMPKCTFTDDDGIETERHYDDFGLPQDQAGALYERELQPLQNLMPRLREASGGPVWLTAAMAYGTSMRGDLAWRKRLAFDIHAPLLATNDVLMHVAERRPLQDVLTAIRLGVSLDDAGRKLEANAERHLKDAAEMTRLFSEAPEAIAETLHFLDGLSFSLDELRGDYPEELREGFATPQEALRAFAYEGAAERFENNVPDKVKTAIEHELALVAELDYAAYFLTVHDIMRFARNQGILCQGRGSAANSTLCFCLRITDVDPMRHQLLFERFISAKRAEPPDIDVDFEHERREEVMEYIYRRYGRARAALTATVVTYRTRSAMREVGKVFGFSDDVLAALAGAVWGSSSVAVDDKEARRAGLDPTEARLKKALALASELTGFPRHLSQHTGGFVITRTRLDEVMPLAHATMEARTTVVWDKDDLDALGILKVDILALGMLTCLSRGFDLLETHYGVKHRLADVPAEEKPVYDMISRADTIGVFQIESRAQMSMLPRLKPKTFYDLVIEVAIVRPGPIQGDMVHPYLRRRQGLEPVEYPSDELKEVLERTLGVPLFQEQAMKIAIVAAGFTPGEADRLRRAMATFKRVGTISTFFDKMVEGMVAKNYPRDFAERCFKQIEGFGTYGFPESHAASFALLVYVSAWMKCRYPDVFCCALLNAQPMGFYAPGQIVRDAREHGVTIEEVDINFSEWNSILVKGEAEGRLHPRHDGMRGEIRSAHCVRLGFRQAKGLSEADMDALVAHRGAGYDSIRDLWLRTGLPQSVLQRLAEADAFRSLGLDRREALWVVKGLNRAGDKDDLPLLKSLTFKAHEPDADLPPMLIGEHVVEDYRTLSLSLKAHPVSFVRALLAAKKILCTEDLGRIENGRRVTVAGLVLVRQRPGSAKGVIFLTLEDETGIANAIIWPKVFEALRPIVMGARFIAVTGRVQSESGVIHVVAERAEDLTPLLGVLSRQGQDQGRVRDDESEPAFSHPACKVIGRQSSQPAQKNQDEPMAQTLLFPLEASLAKDKAAVALKRVLPKGRNFQ
ncbi:error-prone DNA polymerase [Methyloferula stellata]|uniref:error-prone DNA polymerase n=1 Tax=Methyloferula stellata TaxID=876270 RepID=UPI00036B4498|nr:error-prone DNA polymerase [Methyloferula stellata]